MIKVLSEQHATPDINDLNFGERPGLMVDRELTEREDARLSTRLKAARLRRNVCPEDIDYLCPGGLDKSLILQLGSGLRNGLNLIIAGLTGVGKTWLGYALAHGDGRFAKLMAGYAKTDLLIVDDWGLAPLPLLSGATCLNYWTAATATARHW